MTINKEKKENLMRIVIKEVEESIKERNSPFGAILIDENGNIIEKAHNTAKSMCNPVLHAEINLILIVKDYTIKGWVMDDERLKNGGSILTEKYFEEQLERIREIRMSERKFYQKITDIYATSID